ncbi:hypothetical protein JANAI62_06270 [Jannaschia pagri]|uniref:YjiS-like domain-containing protein n=1 Tax=Jannaschia pagri TaxID=2829797 RepID=A0ABQ4NII5_9RHOB|nr:MULTISPECIES: DUF1127 domain-containing protein [unclassified Jannaschia]GIT89889.1 hypothetical protein JANAI61_03470 [Jannaschia sp. AI_61]GIT94004.1 hypothetical protein JANAI62_06270 [Jannaschia sp. AI_62]
MATFDTFRPALPAAHGSLLSNLLGSIIAWNDRRVTLNMLRSLSERELADIGLERGNLEAFAKRR